MKAAIKQNVQKQATGMKTIVNILFKKAPAWQGHSGAQCAVIPKPEISCKENVLIKSTGAAKGETTGIIIGVNKSDTIVNIVWKKRG